MSRVLEHLGSPWVVASLAAPPLIGLALGRWLLGLPWHRLAESRAAGVFAAGLALALVAGALHGLVSRRSGAALVRLGLLALVVSAVATIGAWFSASARLGEGEPVAPWDELQAGPLVGPPGPVVRYLGRDQSDGGSTVRLQLDGRELTLEPGGDWTRVDRHELRVVGLSAAPLFELSNRDGRVLEQGMVKLAVEARGGDYIHVGVLPHRFYLSRIEGDSSAAADTPETLHLRIMRGKLVILDQDLERDQVASFEGLGYRFDRGSTWVEVRVRRRPPRPLVLIGLVLVLAGAVLRRRS